MKRMTKRQFTLVNSRHLAFRRITSLFNVSGICDHVNSLVKNNYFADFVTIKVLDVISISLHVCLENKQSQTLFLVLFKFL